MQKPTDITWGTVSTEVEKAITAVFSHWLGTPYMRGQRARRIGVDCVQLVAGVYDELWCRPTPTIVPRLAPTAGIYLSRAGAATCKALCRGYPLRIARDGLICPGDGIVTRGVLNEASPRRMGHVALAGVRPWTFLHAIPGAGVCWASIEAMPGLLRCFRPIDKEAWTCNSPSH